MLLCLHEGNIYVVKKNSVNCNFSDLNEVFSPNSIVTHPHRKENVGWGKSSLWNSTQGQGCHFNKRLYIRDHLEAVLETVDTKGAHYSFTSKTTKDPPRKGKLIFFFF